MALLSKDAFAEIAPTYDDAVRCAPLPDRVCSASAWVLSAHTAFTPDAEVRVLHTGAGFAPLMAMKTVLGTTWMPLEASWGLASPLVGEDLDAIAADFAAHALAHPAQWDALFLSGLTRGEPAFNALVHRFGRRHRLGLGQVTRRCVASLEGGEDGFLARRPSKFRKNARRAERQAADHLEVTVVHEATPEEAAAHFERIVRIERLSWKSRDGHGIDDGPMRRFYAEMVPALAAQGRLRITFGTWDGADAGYVLGAIMDGAYRGLQISVDANLSAYSLGNLLQLHTVRSLVAEGAHTYDLGTDMPYKQRWAEQRIDTVPLVVR